MTSSADTTTQQLYWGKKITSFYARTDETLNRIANLFIFFLILVSIIGKGAGALYVLEESSREAIPLAQYFFSDLHFYILFFWVSIGIDLYLYYRLTIASEKVSNIYRDFIHIDKKQKRIDVSHFFTKEALRTVERSVEIAKKYKQLSVLPFHFFITLLDTRDIREVFARLEIDYKRITAILARQLQKHEINSSSDTAKGLSADCIDILVHAGSVALRERKKNIDEIGLFQALIERGELVKDILYEFDIDDTTLRNTISWIQSRKAIYETYRHSRFRSRLKPRSHIDRAMTGVETPYAASMSTDLTLMAKRGALEPFINRGNILEKMYHSLESQKNVLLIGLPGVGKTAAVEGLASRMASEDVPQFLKDKRLIEVNAERLVGGFGAAASIERMMRLFDEVARAGNVVLAIENINRLTGISSGGDQSLDLADVIGSLIHKKRVYVIGTAEPTQYSSRNTIKTALSQVFRTVTIEEPDKNETIRILASKALFIESRYYVFFTYSAIESLYELSLRFMPKNYLPKKAVDLLDEISIAKKGTKKQFSKITKLDIEKVISRKVHIPLTDIGAGEREKLMNLEELLHKKIVSQNSAVNAVANALRRARTELKSRERPIANFLFLGPTGVGKTALAKAVSEIYFGTSYHMTRLDMNVFQGKDSIHTLIGREGETGELTRSLEEHPYGLLLLDEIEKADRDIINVFLQLMDEGRITDGRGLRIDATNVLLVATSNAGSQFIQDKLRAGESVQAITKDLAETQLRNYFLPEFLNRFDEIIVFKTLTMDDVREITKITLEELKNRIKKHHGILLTVDDSAVSYIANEGYKEEYGARQLLRTVQRIIEDPLSKIILTKQAMRRDNVHISGRGIFTIKRADHL